MTPEQQRIAESEFVYSLQVNQRKDYWKLKEQVQADAHAQGMTDAAEIVKRREQLLQNNNCKDTIREHYASVEILSARDQKGQTK